MSKRFDIVAIGEAMVEFNQTSAPGNCTYLQGFGGDTSNAVIAAARQGVRCAYVTRLGDDEFGRMCLALWASEGVDSSAILSPRQAACTPRANRARSCEVVHKPAAASSG